LAVSKVILSKDTVGYDSDSPIRIVTYLENRIDIEFTKSALSGLPEVPIRPKAPNSKVWIGREYYSQKEILERNLKVLRMTSQEEVSGSTYGAILEFL
jgi:hypothetical protein